MINPTPDWPLLDEYDVRFDQPIEPVVFGRALDIHGWLIHRQGKPIHGIRAIVKHRFSKPKIIRARRKRNRTEPAVTYPHLPDAMASGFLLELRLGLGRNELTFQVQDHERVWKTFHETGVFLFPSPILTKPGFANLHRSTVLHFKHLAAPKSSSAAEGDCLDTSSFISRTDEPLGPITLQPRVRLFVTSKSNLFIIEIGKLIAAGFRDVGCDVEMLVDRIPEQKSSPDTLQIVVTPHEFYNLFLRDRLSRPRLRQLTPDLFLVCAEQPETHWFHNNLPWTFHARGVADISALGAAAYRARGIRCHHLQLGYHNMLASDQLPTHQSRSLDIAFMGSLTPKREAFFSEHAEFFSEHSCHLRLVPLGFAKTSTTRSYLEVEERNRILSQSRILLNVHYSDQTYFEWHRILVALANGCCIITETSQGHGPLQPGKHFVMVEPEDLIPCCEYYLAHPTESARIADQGLEFIRHHLRQDQACRRFLNEIQSMELAPAERAFGNGSTPPSIALPVDSPPAPLPMELGEQLSKGAAGRFGRALQRDLHKLVALFRKSSVVPEDALEKNVDADPLAREAIIRKREACHDRWIRQEAMRQRGEPFLELHDNAAFVSCQDPPISILVTLYNYAGFIEECVASVNRAVEKFGEACEVLIVNDASTDHSLARAIQCQRRFSLPIRVVNKKLNTGLADARNIALELARAPYVFILDADNLIYPNALLQLHRVITSDDYAAAYSLLCRFQGTPRNRIGLLSYFDWDPEVLVQFPYIDAMAMFRRDALRETPGYDHQLSQIGWFGWEDYDMWLRFAKKQYRVAFVPNILCLYRYHVTSMINSTVLFRHELVQHFIATYGELLERFEPREQLFGVERAELLVERDLRAR